MLIGRTEGNPLFLEESVRSLVETRVLVGEPGAYCLPSRSRTCRYPRLCRPCWPHALTASRRRRSNSCRRPPPLARMSLAAAPRPLSICPRTTANTAWPTYKPRNSFMRPPLSRAGLHFQARLDAGSGLQRRAAGAAQGYMGALHRPSKPCGSSVWRNTIIRWPIITDAVGTPPRRSATCNARHSKPSSARPMPRRSAPCAPP